VNRSPSGNTIYRHQTPPKELPQSQFPQSNNGGSALDNDFVVHKSKGITTLFNLQDPLIPAKLRQAKEKTNNDSKADERGEQEEASRFGLIHVFFSALFLFFFFLPFSHVVSRLLHDFHLI
jgi:calmodulin-regulated spectrin-associated protein